MTPSPRPTSSTQPSAGRRDRKRAMKPVNYRMDGFPPRDLDWEELLPAIGPAHAAVAAYQGMLYRLPNTSVLLSPLASREAVLSNRIEGTITTMAEVLTFEAEGDPSDESTPAKADMAEVLNYRFALYSATELMKEIPLSQRLVRETHKMLLRGVRGYDKDPGNYRRIPNSVWIGPPGSTIEGADFVPCPVEHLPKAMDAWEFFIHEEAYDLLVQLAITHAEFEAIHPFLDGNGRMGRLLVPLFMVSKDLLSHPHFYLSEYLDLHRDEYYERLMAVSRDGDWTGWCSFFLRAITEQAQMNQKKVQAILDLYNERREWIVEKTHSQYGGRALDWIFGVPIFMATDFTTKADIPKPTANRILRALREEGMFRVLRPSSGRRSAILAFTDLLNIAEGRDVF